MQTPGDFLGGLVLAGGVGERFGGPKAWARLPDGRTFLEACAATLRSAGADPVVATLPPGSDDPSIDGLAVVPLSEPGLDMFVSLKVGLQRLAETASWNRVALLPVDHPLVQPASVVTLASSPARAAIPSFHGKHGHPLVMDRKAAEAIIDGSLPGPTLREVLRAVGAVAVEVDDLGTTANCNTPEELQRAWDSTYRT